MSGPRSERTPGELLAVVSGGWYREHSNGPVGVQAHQILAQWLLELE